MSTFIAIYDVYTIEVFFFKIMALTFWACWFSHFFLLFNKSPQNTQKNIEKIIGDYDKKSSVPFCVFVIA